MDLDLREMMRLAIAGGDDAAVRISHVRQIARLREFKARHDAGCPFAVGDLVTPRADGCAKAPGRPHVVVATRPDPAPCFVGTQGSNMFGAACDIRVAGFHDGTLTMWWVESVYFEPYTEAHEKAEHGNADGGPA